MNQLYCIVYARLRNGVVFDTEFEYVHAPDQLHAKATFQAAHSRALIARRIEIVEVAPAVGVQSLDDNGDQLVM